MRPTYAAIGLGVIAVLALGIWAGTRPTGEQVIGCYVTGLNGRTASQIHNLIVATRRINGMTLQPGQVFSFVKRVGPWTADMGYEQAPVSYDGELIRSWGGGVCQTSTTLYNAALLAGLKIVERHHHHWPARYAPLGRDAAVAYSDIDLKIENTLPAQVRIVGEVRGEKLAFKILSTYQPGCTVQIESRMRSVTRPGKVILDRPGVTSGRWKLVNRGHPGFCVATYRKFIGSHPREELVSQDSYPSMNSVVTVARR